MRQNALEFAVGKSIYSRVSCDEYDFDRAEHLHWSQTASLWRMLLAQTRGCCGTVISFLCSIGANFARVNNLKDPTDRLSEVLQWAMASHCLLRIWASRHCNTPGLTLVTDVQREHHSPATWQLHTE